jgi:hypothetical protein
VGRSPGGRTSDGLEGVWTFHEERRALRDLGTEVSR